MVAVAPLVLRVERGVEVQLVARGPVLGRAGVPQRVERGVVAVVAAREVVEVVGDLVEDNFNLDEITNDLNNLTGGNHGDNATFDALWDACAAEDWASCDQLYLDSPFGSEYESFGDTCGNRTDGSADCLVALGGAVDPHNTSGNNYGDNAYLDGLWDSCTAEDWQACDDLYLQSDVGSGYKAYGDTCGNKYVAGTQDYCVDVMP